MDAAQRVFERDGLEKTTIRAIASEAGCTTGAVYPWFAGKEAIYGALLDESLQRLHAHLIDTAARSLPSRPRVTRSAPSATTRTAPPTSRWAYLFRGPGPRGLGREMDEQLNGRLRDSIDLLGQALARTKPWDAATIATEQMNTFTYLMGLLLLLHTHRLKSWASRPTRCWTNIASSWSNDDRPRRSPPAPTPRASACPPSMRC